VRAQTDDTGDYNLSHAMLELNGTVITIAIGRIVQMWASFTS